MRHRRCHRHPHNSGRPTIWCWWRPRCCSCHPRRGGLVVIVVLVNLIAAVGAMPGMVWHCDDGARCTVLSTLAQERPVVDAVDDGGRVVGGGSGFLAIALLAVLAVYLVLLTELVLSPPTYPRQHSLRCRSRLRRCQWFFLRGASYHPFVALSFCDRARCPCRRT